MVLTPFSKLIWPYRQIFYFSVLCSIALYVYLHLDYYYTIFIILVILESRSLSSSVWFMFCFHFLAIVNRTAVNTAKQVSAEEDVEPFGHMPRGALAGHTVDLFLTLWESSTPISTVPVPICNTTAVNKSPFPASLRAFDVACLVYPCPFHWVQMKSQSLDFPNCYGWWDISHQSLRYFLEMFSFF